MRTTQTTTHDQAGCLIVETAAPTQPTIKERIDRALFDLWSQGAPSFIADVQYMYLTMLEFQTVSQMDSIDPGYHYDLAGRMFSFFQIITTLNELHEEQRDIKKGGPSHE